MTNLAPLFSSASVEWYTPPWVLDLARDVMGSIELDPCSSDLFTTGSERYYTINDDGLSRTWESDSLWLNPPYGKEISAWTNKYLEQYNAMGQAMTLLPARTDTKWFQSLRYDAILFLKGRISFVEGERLRYLVWLLGKDVAMKYWDKCTGDAAAFPSVITYKGHMLGKARFIERCSKLGLVMTPGLYM